MAVCALACAANLATGERHLNLISESQEIEMGQQSDRQVIASIGLYPDSSLQRYVRDLGVTLAKKSERPNLPWTFRVVDDPAVNAFAVPGGFIYVTRGLMTHVMNEAQLAAVIGHEIGHVTAQHSVHRISEQQLAQLGLTLGMMLEPDLQQYGDYIGTGLGLLFLKFSRDDEKEADDLGMRYMVRGGSDPREMIDVFTMLERVTDESGGGRVPEWLATHPSPGNRRERLATGIDTIAEKSQSLEVNQDAYLAVLDGTVFGEDPREGFFRENHFYHPELAFEFTFPSGWTTVNQKRGVIGVSPSEDAIIQITLADEGSAQAAANDFVSQDGLEATRPDRGTLNGLPAVTAEFRAQADGGVLRGLGQFVELKGNTYQILAYSSESRWSNYTRTAQASLRSFMPVTDPDVLNAQPMRVEIIRPDRQISLEQLAKRENSPASLRTLALINQVDTDAVIPAGQRVKIVKGERPLSQTRR